MTVTHRGTLPTVTATTTMMGTRNMAITATSTMMRTTTTTTIIITMTMLR